MPHPDQASSAYPAFGMAAIKGTSIAVLSIDTYKIFTVRAILQEQKKGIFFAVCDERYLPDRMKVYVTDSTLQEANSQLYMSMLERIGAVSYTHLDVYKRQG